MKKRNKIRIISFLTAIIFTLSVWGAAESIAARKYKNEVNAENQRALTALAEYMNSIDTALTKSIYATDGKMISSLCASLIKDSAGAKQSLSSLSSGDTELLNTFRFLTQVGEYTRSLVRKASEGEEITAEERETLKSLQKFSAGLALQFSYMASLMSDSYLSFGELDRAVADTEKGSEAMVSYMEGIGRAEDAMTDFPSLIYDGPFSDNIFTKESELLYNAEEITEEQAREKAAEVLETEAKYLVTDTPHEGKIPVYTFVTDVYSVEITRNGGYISEIISSPTVGEEVLSGADATENASLFLYNCGYTDMVSTYYSCADGICTVNFAYKDSEYICYPDLIKVSVALDSGKVTGLEASDFIMNHRERQLKPPLISEEEAKKGLSPELTPEKTGLAVIPAKGGDEKAVYEILCTDGNGRHILIYKNTETGREEDILILLYLDGGTLTK